MKWIKASEENFPQYFGTFHFRDIKTKYPINAGIAYHLAKKGDYNFEMLDESPSRSEGLDEVIKEMEDILYGLRENNFQAGRLSILNNLIPKLKALAPHTTIQTYYELNTRLAEELRTANGEIERLTAALARSEGEREQRIIEGL